MAFLMSYNVLPSGAVVNRSANYSMNPPAGGKPPAESRLHSPAAGDAER